MSTSLACAFAVYSTDGIAMEGHLDENAMDRAAVFEELKSLIAGDNTTESTDSTSVTAAQTPYRNYVYAINVTLIANIDSTTMTAPVYRISIFAGLHGWLAYMWQKHILAPHMIVGAPILAALSWNIKRRTYFSMPVHPRVASYAAAETIGG